MCSGIIQPCTARSDDYILYKQTYTSKVGAMCFFSLGAGHKAGSRGQSAASTRSRPNHGEAASHGRFFGGVVISSASHGDLLHLRHSPAMALCRPRESVVSTHFDPANWWYHLELRQHRKPHHRCQVLLLLLLLLPAAPLKCSKVPRWRGGVQRRCVEVSG